jgi:hypothetical protein
MEGWMQVLFSLLLFIILHFHLSVTCFSLSGTAGSLQPNLQPASYPIRLDIAYLTNHKLVGEVSHCNGSSVLQACGWCLGAYRKYMYAAGSARARR